MCGVLTMPNRRDTLPDVATTRRRKSITPTTQPAQPTNGRVLEARSLRRRNAKPRGASVPEPHTVERLAWYAGLTMMALFEVIEWPIAVVIAVGHEISHRARSRAIRQLAEGIEAGRSYAASWTACPSRRGSPWATCGKKSSP